MERVRIFSIFAFGKIHRNVKKEFTGFYLDFDQLIAMLRSQGLEIEDEKKAKNILSNVSYARLKSYLIPLMEDRSTHRFKPGATFGQAYALYGFDRRLRELIFHEMEKFEISLRTHIANATSGAEKGYWFINPDYFKNPRDHANLLRKMLSDINRSDNDAIVRFKEKYSNDFPPCWLTLEATSMGTLAIIFAEMKPGPFKSRIADYYGISEAVLNSWIQHLVYVRNYCAHHNRLWNKHLAVEGLVPERTRDPFPDLEAKDSRKIYFTLCVLKYLVNVIKPDNNFALRLVNLIDSFKTVRTESEMGFPSGWKDDPFWRVY